MYTTFMSHLRHGSKCYICIATGIYFANFDLFFTAMAVFQERSKQFQNFSGRIPWYNNNPPLLFHCQTVLYR